MPKMYDNSRRWRENEPRRSLREAWRMRVAGPLPGRPGERGEFVMTARVCSRIGGWWIAPEPGSTPAGTGR
jgi:hypothetical protein